MRATLYPELVEKVEGLGRRGQVLAGIWAGRGTKEIAADLGISPKTVEYHRARLYRLFGVSDLVSLCRRAIAVGLINPKAERRSEGCRRQCLRQCPRICEARQSRTSQPGRRARVSGADARTRAI